MTLRVALIGFGLAGKVFHAPLITAVEGMKLSAIVTANAERIADASRLYPSAKIIPSADDVFKDAKNFDLVVIASPNKHHASQANSALEAGLAVVVDKPFGRTLKECEELVSQSRAKKKLLSVFHNRRWDNDFLTIKKLLSDGVLGKIMRFESRFERYRPEVNPNKWRESGGIEEGGGLLLDLQSHLIDQACHLFGVPKSVYAEVDRRRQGATSDDDTFLALHFESGVRAHLWANVISAITGPRFHIRGLEGSYEKHQLDPQEDALRNGQTPHSPGFGVEAQERSGKLAINNGGTIELRTVISEPGRYQDFYKDIRDAINEGRKPAVTAEEALLTMRVIETARKSASEGRIVPLIERASPTASSRL